MTGRGRPIAAAICGVLFGLSSGVSLVLLGALRLDSTLLAVLPTAGLVGGAALGWFAPFGRLRRSRATVDGETLTSEAAEEGVEL